MSSWKDWPICVLKKSEYPDDFKNIIKPPEKMYFRGRWEKQIFSKTLAVVGSRKMTRYGEEVVESIIPELVSRGITIVSGFMYGIDTKAHRTTLSSGGTTIAVLGSGLDNLATAANDNLYTEILISGGIVMTEYEPGFTATKWSFPQRNRIVAGISNLGTIVVEAAMNSGSLITADYATKSGRNVWAVPGQINFPTSKGTNYLIKEEQAKIFTEVDQIETNQLAQPIQPGLFDLDSEEVMVLKSFSQGDCLDNIYHRSRLSISRIGEIVGMLELKGLIKQVDSEYYLTPLSKSIIL